MADLDLKWWFIILIVSVLIAVFRYRYITKLLNFSWYIIIHIAIGAIFVFLFNIFGELVNIYIPINLFTSSAVGLLGIPGLATLLIIKFLIIPI